MKVGLSPKGIKSFDVTFSLIKFQFKIKLNNMLQNLKSLQ